MRDKAAHEDATSVSSDRSCRLGGFGRRSAEVGCELVHPMFERPLQQKVIVGAVLHGGNLKIKAYAGAGKTSTLRLLANRLDFSLFLPSRVRKAEVTMHRQPSASCGK
jgi:hypothetical protein